MPPAAQDTAVQDAAAQDAAVQDTAAQDAAAQDLAEEEEGAAPEPSAPERATAALPAVDPFDRQAAMMAPAAAGAARATVPPPGRLRRFTAEECRQMLEAGILHEDEPFELIDGHLMLMMSTGPRHRWCVTELARLLTLRLAEHDDTLRADVQCPIRLNDLTEPEPDVAITRRADAPRIPVPEDVLLVVEVSDSTLAKDQGDKMPRYAAAGIPEMWLVNLPREAVEVYRDPRPEAATYATKTTVGADATLTLAALPDAGSLAVADFLP